MPGTNFKFQKIQELARLRKEQLMLKKQIIRDRGLKNEGQAKKNKQLNEKKRNTDLSKFVDSRQFQSENILLNSSKE